MIFNVVIFIKPTKVMPKSMENLPNLRLHSKGVKEYSYIYSSASLEQVNAWLTDDGIRSLVINRVE